MVEKNKWILKDSEEERNERQQWQRKIDQKFEPTKIMIQIRTNIKS